MKILSVSKNGAIADFELEDCLILMMAINEASQEYEGKETVYLRKSGYFSHSFDYLSDWLSDNRATLRPLEEAQLEADARLKATAPPVKRKDKLLISKVADVDGPALRLSLTLDALKIFDAAITATLDYHADDDPPDGELGTVTGYGTPEFTAVHQVIKEILTTEATL